MRWEVWPVKENEAIITSSYMIGNVYGKKITGGLIGTGRRATITASYVNATIHGNEDVDIRDARSGQDIGGLVGFGDRVVITNSYAIGDIRGRDYIAGLVGYGDKATITNSYAANNINGGNNIGGLINYGSGTNARHFLLGH